MHQMRYKEWDGCMMHRMNEYGRMKDAQWVA